MRRTIVLLAAMAAMVVVYAGAALAAPVDEVEPNNTVADAQNIDAYFSLDADPNISSDKTGTTNTSTTEPHATINGTGDGTADYYSITAPEAGIASFDIDGAYKAYPSPSFDSVLRLYNSNGDQLWADDDNLYVDPGSQSTKDSYLQWPLPSAGTYYIQVSSGLFANPIDAGNSYQLNVSIPNHPVPDNTAPTVTLTNPADNGTMSNRASNVTATFSENVQNVNATTFKLEQVKVSRKGVETTSPVAATVTPASGTVAQGASATLDPSKDLQRGSTYRATLTNGVTDTAGHALGAPYTWTFKVSR